MKQIRETAKELRKTREMGTTPVLATQPFLTKPTTASTATHRGSFAEGSEEVVVIPEDNSDSDSVIVKNKLKREETFAIERFQLEKCTTLTFISLTGVITEIELKKRILTYSDLQREIARLTPKHEKNKMFVIQNSAGTLK